MNINLFIWLFSKDMKSFCVLLLLSFYDGLEFGLNGIDVLL